MKLLVLAMLTAPVFLLFGQEGAAALPPELLMPRYGETPRFPYDYWVGELGRGQASEEAYRAARRFLEQFMNGNYAAAPERVRESLAVLGDLETRAVRVGEGRNEADGAVSFLFRFLGREEAVTGEIYLKPPPSGADAAWRIDELVLGKKRPLGEGRYSPNNLTITPYERFF